MAQNNRKVLKKKLKQQKQNKWKKIIKWLALGAIFVFVGTMVVIQLVMLSLDEVGIPDLESRSVVLDREGNEIVNLFEEYRIELTIDQIPDEIIDGIIAVEDKRFYDHIGIDIKGLTRAMLVNIRAMDIVEGGSTITQQLARNYYLDHERTIGRKVKEFFLTIYLERTLSKEEIIKKYLNAIYFGHGAHGIEAASKIYFGTGAEELTLAEQALLIGLPRGPYYYTPYNNMEAAKKRRRVVLDEMVEEGIVSSQEAEQAKQAPITLSDERPTIKNAPYFIDEVVNRLENKLVEQVDEEQIAAGGLKIHTTLDLELQNHAKQILDADLPVEQIDNNEIRQPQGVIVAIDPDTGHVKTMVGGRDYDETQYNRALATRQAGSVFKPYVYASALEQRDYTPIDQMTCEPTDFVNGDDVYSVSDYGGTYHHDDLTVRRAIKESCNVSAVKVHQDLGITPSVEMAKELGINEDRIQEHLSFPLGTSEITPMELVSSYVPFANSGLAVEPIIITKVEGPDGSIIYRGEANKNVALDDRVAFQLTNMMEEVISPGGTASSISWGTNFSAAAKTGTTQGHHDAVFVGYTPELVTSVFVMDDNNELNVGTGGRVAAPLWLDYMNFANQKYDFSEFLEPDGLVKQKICQESLMMATDECPKDTTFTEYFLPGTEPRETCDVHEPQEPFWPWWGIW